MKEKQNNPFGFEENIDCISSLSSCLLWKSKQIQNVQETDVMKHRLLKRSQDKDTYKNAIKYLNEKYFNSINNCFRTSRYLFHFFLIWHWHIL